MTHPVSGNPTWQDYPDLSTPVTAAGLEAIENGLDGHRSRITKLEGPPVVEARLTTDYTALPGNNYLGVRGQMAVPSGMDPYGMWTTNGTDNLYTIKPPTGWPGRYRIDWAMYCSGIAVGVQCLALAFLNAPPGVANTSLGPYTALRCPSPGGSPVWMSGELQLSTTDTISLGVYIYQASTFNMLATFSGAIARTKVVMRWVNPV